MRLTKLETILTIFYLKLLPLVDTHTLYKNTSKILSIFRWLNSHGLKVLDIYLPYHLPTDHTFFIIYVGKSQVPVCQRNLTLGRCTDRVIIKNPTYSNKLFLTTTYFITFSPLVKFFLNFYFSNKKPT